MGEPRLSLGFDVSTQGVKLLAVEIPRKNSNAHLPDGSESPAPKGVAGEPFELAEVAEVSVNYDADLPHFATSGGVHRGRIVEDGGKGHIDGEKEETSDVGCDESVTSPALMFVEAMEFALDCMDALLGQLPLEGNPPSYAYFRQKKLGAVASISGAGQQHGSVYWRRDPAEIFNSEPSSPVGQQSGETRERPLPSLRQLFSDPSSAFSVPDCPIWMDSTTGKDCHELEALVGGAQSLADRTGSSAFERFTVNQIHRLATRARTAGADGGGVAVSSDSADDRVEVEDGSGGERTEKTPTSFAMSETRRVSLISSFGASLLTGRWIGVDYADASGMNCMDLKTKEWDANICSWALGPQFPGMLGDLVDPRSVVGKVTRYFVDRWGFAEDCHVVAWTGDNPSSLAGLRLRAGDVAVSLGTSDTLFTTLGNPTPGLMGHVFVDPVHPGDYMGLLCYTNGSLTREHYRDLYADSSWERFAEFLRASPAGNDGILGFVFREVEIAPAADKGTWWFDTRNNCAPAASDKLTAAQRVRGLVEGRFLAMLAHARALGLPISSTGARIVVTGGASTNSAIAQVIADVFGLPVFGLEQPHSAAVGAAYRAWHGLAREEKALASETVPEGEGVTFDAAVAFVETAATMNLIAEPNAALRNTYDDLVIAYTRCEPLVSRGEAGASIEMSNDAWFAQRAWSVSANKVLTHVDGNDGVSHSSLTSITSLADRIYRPRSAEEIAALVRKLPRETPIACVCGGHGSSGAALVAERGSIIFDLAELKRIVFEGGDGDGERLVTVGSGVVFRELVEAVREEGGALPVGTGPGVGVVGYTINGGLSGYFSRRLGLLGQRAVKMTVVMADGTLRTLTPDDELFTLMLGAGSALAIVVDMTFRLADARAIQGAEQIVFGFDGREQAVAFSRAAMQFMKEAVIPNESVSVEVVVTGTKSIVVTAVFYDSFTGNANEFTGPLRALAVSSHLLILADTRWSSWYESATALWPVIAAMKGSPLATSCHCTGTLAIPEDKVLDFVANVMVGEAPLGEAEMSIIEIRTLGGAAQTGPRIPTGNCEHAFFVDVVTLYDASLKTLAERQAIVDLTNRLVDGARAVSGLGVDFSGTHSQSDDVNRSTVAAEVFGSSKLAQAVSETKARVDPANRFRFHPFAKILT